MKFLHGGELPVVPVTTVSDCPDYEKGPGHGRTKRDGTELITVRQRTDSDMSQSVW